MANLLNAEVLKLYKERPRKREIDIGVSHQARLRFHTETVIRKEHLSPYYQLFLRWICVKEPELLPPDKVARFIQLITTPIPTVELTESIFAHLKNVFRAQDAFFRYEFIVPENEDDWESFVDYDWWQTHGFQAMINAIDSVWVLDLPGEQTTDMPEPKDRLIDISNIVDISCDLHNKCDYVIFKINDKVYEYDDTFMRVYQVDQNGEIIVPEKEIPHGLGYCPARMFWSDMLMTGDFINKKAPLTNVLGDLDWLLVCHIFKKYMEVANSYPILAAYRPQDNYEGSRQEEDRGRALLQNQPLRGSLGINGDSSAGSSRRPIGGDLMGPGTILTVTPPLQGEPDPMANPIKFINPDVANLTFHVENLQAKRDQIFYSVVGKESEVTQSAINEKQVMSSFESQTTILLRIAYNFKLIQEFAERCKIQIRYGIDSLKAISIDYGTKFFLKTTTDLLQDLDLAKKYGSHTSVVSTIMNEITESKYRNDHRGMTRAQIMQELDPLADKTQDEADKILDKGGITDEQYIVKSNLLSFCSRFEREQAPLVEFAAGRPYDKKITLILEEFKKYATEISDNLKPKTPPVIPGAANLMNPVNTNNINANIPTPVQ